jgi:L-2-hydroxyglutarate oxidase
MKSFDIAIVGGGIVGLATAYQLGVRFPGRKILILEKESGVAKHQTGRNSGVLHSGIYYKPGSLKATNCREGKKAMEAFCEAEGVAYELCGKVIVAVDESELGALETIFERGRQNGVKCEKISAGRLREIEPHVAGIAAIHVPETGIVDYVGVCEKLAARIQERGGEIVFGAKVLKVDVRGESVVLETSVGAFEAKHAINCAGLHSDRVASLTGQKPEVKIVPFRGEYFELKPEAEHLCRHLIYPTPDPAFPFLGVHFTRMVLGGVECGPNAVLAFAREGYSKTHVNPYDLAESLTYPGFIKMALKHWRMGAGEMWRSASKAAFVKALQRLVPEIKAEHLHAAPAGVRAQAVGRDGKMVDDFLIQTNGRVINVLNSPSPAATAALNIGEMIARELG